jgi:hypothetical protein
MQSQRDDLASGRRGLPVDFGELLLETFHAKRARNTLILEWFFLAEVPVTFAAYDFHS